MSTFQDWLASVFGYGTVLDEGTPLPKQNGLNFIGCTVANNPALGTTDVTPPGASGVITSVTGTAPIGVTSGPTPVVSIAAASDSAAGSMSASDKAMLDALTGVVEGGTSTLDVLAASVFNQPSAGNGPQTQISLFTTANATPGTCTFALASNTGGPVDVIISAVSATDGGSVAWRGKVVDLSGTTTVTKAFAAVDTWDSTSGASTWTVAVAEASGTVTVTCTGSAGQGTIHWTVAFQYVSAES